MKKTLITAALCALTIPCAAVAQGPTGFDKPVKSEARPQGFELSTLKSLDEVKKHGRDDQLVVVRGRLTRQMGHDKYEFTDEKGNKIIAELEDDRDLSHVAKDALVDILAEVDRSKKKVELEVLQAKPVR